jgi:hypothetical protein
MHGANMKTIGDQSTNTPDKKVSENIKLLTKVECDF